MPRANLAAQFDSTVKLESESTAPPLLSSPTLSAITVRRFSGLSGLSELEWYGALRGPIIFLVYLFHGLSSLNFTVLGLLHMTATPFETRSLHLYHPKSCGVVYSFVAALHVFPFVRHVVPSREFRIHSLHRLTSLRKFPLLYRLHPRWVARMELPPYVGPILVRLMRVLFHTWIAYDMAARLVDGRSAHIYALILIGNGLATSWIVFIKHTGLQKTLFAFLQSFLAFLLSSGFPLFAFVVPIVRYRVEGTGVEPHDFRWLATTLASTRFLVITYPHQLVLNVSLSVLNYMALQHVASRLGPKSRRSGVSSHGRSSSRQVHHSNSGLGSSRVSIAAKMTSFRLSGNMQSIVHGLHQIRVDHENRRLLRLVFVVDLAWSMLVLVLTMLSEYTQRQCPPHCVLQSKPWFTTACNCIYARVDCNATHQDLDDVIHPDLLGANLLYLHTRHCELPHGVSLTVLAPFPFLYGLQLEFTGMTDWNVPSSSLSPSIMMVLIRYSQLREVPLVLQTPWPTLHTLILVGAPIQRVPPHVWQHWGALSSLWLSHTRLEQFPLEVLSIHTLETLALDSNHLSSIPPGLESLPYLSKLYLASTTSPTFRPH
ncbi:hypothetical protein DYB32_003419 [Aphanomyces invadans]|uniref:Uncharacterized protein n=1 Tax=Aphanomyces invadans TaxID=157072 RepID=A0A418B0P7_9STRA|nr:hypothetical protein DYB32_003419 [Aphanomyces invadans]